MSPCLIPKLSLSTFTSCATQLVVQEALDTTRWLLGSYSSAFTPRTNVLSSLVAGAEMMTFLAPASMWAAAFSPSVKNPVDSMTISTPRSPQGSLAGSRSDSDAMERPSISMAPSPASTVPGYLP